MPAPTFAMSVVQVDLIMNGAYTFVGNGYVQNVYIINIVVLLCLYVYSPAGQYCYSDVAESDCETMHYCGIDFEDAKSCGYPCPSGSTLECPSGLGCYLNISSGECKKHGFCGKSRELAKQCNSFCEGDGDCGVSEKCFSDIALVQCETMNYCGTSLADAQSCSLPCPSGLDIDCPVSQTCYVDITSEECGYNEDDSGNDNDGGGSGGTELDYDDDTGIIKYDNPEYYMCGATIEDARSCSTSCESGLDSDCPDGEYW